MIIREVLARFGVEVDGEAAIENLAKKFDLGEGKAKQLIGALGRLAGAFTAASAAVGFAHWMSQSANATSDAAQQIGIATDALQEWRYVASMSASSAEEMDAALGRLRRSLAGADAGGKEQVRALRQLGVEYKNADGSIRPLDDILTDVTTNFSRVESETQRTRLAMALFGNVGQKLSPLLARGGAGIAALRREFQELGGGASEEAIAAAAEYNDNLTRMRVASQSLGYRIMNQLLPGMIRFTEVLSSGVAWLSSWADRTYVLEAGMGAFFTALAVVGVASAMQLITAFAPLIATFGTFAVAIGLVFLLVEDLVALFSGGRSLIGAFIDEFAGAGTAARRVAQLKAGWEDLWNIIKSTWDLAGEAWDWFAGVFGIAAESTGVETRTDRRGLADEDGQRFLGNVRDDVEQDSHRLAQRQAHQRARADLIAATGRDVLGEDPDQQYRRITEASSDDSGRTLERSRRRLTIDTDTASGFSMLGNQAYRFAEAPTMEGAPPIYDFGHSDRQHEPIVATGDTHITLSVTGNPTQEQTRELRRILREEIDARQERDLAAIRRQAIE